MATSGAALIDACWRNRERMDSSYSAGARNFARSPLKQSIASPQQKARRERSRRHASSSKGGGSRSSQSGRSGASSSGGGVTLTFEQKVENARLVADQKRQLVLRKQALQKEEFAVKKQQQAARRAAEARMRDQLRQAKLEKVQERIAEREAAVLLRKQQQDVKRGVAYEAELLEKEKALRM